MITNPLRDAIPEKYRKTVYALAFLVGLAYTAYTASNGDIKLAIGAFIASLVPALAVSNTGGAASGEALDDDGHP